MNSAVERAHTLKVITSCGTNALVTPSQGALKVVISCGTNDLVTPYHGALKVVTNRGATDLVTLSRDALKVTTHCGARKVVPRDAGNCYVKRTEEREKLMTEPGIASVPTVRAVTAERKQLRNSM